MTNYQIDSLNSIVTYVDRPNLLIQATMNDEEPEPYIKIVQRIPMGEKAEQILHIGYDVRIDEKNSNMLCDGQLPFYFKIETPEDWYIINKTINETISVIYEITQCLINIEIPELNDLPAFVKIYFTASVPLIDAKPLKRYLETWPKIHEAIVMFIKEHKDRLSNEQNE